MDIPLWARHSITNKLVAPAELNANVAGSGSNNCESGAVQSPHRHRHKHSRRHKSHPNDKNHGDTAVETAPSNPKPASRHVRIVTEHQVGPYTSPVAESPLLPSSQAAKPLKADTTTAAMYPKHSPPPWLAKQEKRPVLMTVPRLPISTVFPLGQQRAVPVAALGPAFSARVPSLSANPLRKTDTMGAAISNTQQMITSVTDRRKSVPGPRGPDFSTSFFNPMAPRTTDSGITTRMAALPTGNLTERRTINESPAPVFRTAHYPSLPRNPVSSPVFSQLSSVRASSDLTVRALTERSAARVVPPSSERASMNINESSSPQDARRTNLIHIEPQNVPSRIINDGPLETPSAGLKGPDRTPVASTIDRYASPGAHCMPIVPSNKALDVSPAIYWPSPPSNHTANAAVTQIKLSQRVRPVTYATSFNAPPPGPGLAYDKAADPASRTIQKSSSLKAVPSPALSSIALSSIPVSPPIDLSTKQTTGPDGTDIFGKDHTLEKDTAELTDTLKSPPTTAVDWTSAPVEHSCAACIDLQICPVELLVYTAEQTASVIEHIHGIQQSNSRSASSHDSTKESLKVCESKIEEISLAVKQIIDSLAVENTAREAPAFASLIERWDLLESALKKQAPSCESPQDTAGPAGSSNAIGEELAKLCTNLNDLKVNIQLEFEKSKQQNALGMEAIVDSFLNVQNKLGGMTSSGMDEHGQIQRRDDVILALHSAVEQLSYPINALRSSVEEFAAQRNIEDAYMQHQTVANLEHLNVNIKTVSQDVQQLKQQMDQVMEHTDRILTTTMGLARIAGGIETVEVRLNALILMLERDHLDQNTTSGNRSPISLNSESPKNALQSFCNGLAEKTKVTDDFDDAKISLRKGSAAPATEDILKALELLQSDLLDFERNIVSAEDAKLYQRQILNLLSTAREVIADIRVPELTACGAVPKLLEIIASVENSVKTLAFAAAKTARQEPVNVEEDVHQWINETRALRQDLKDFICTVRQDSSQTGGTKENLTRVYASIISIISKAEQRLESIAAQFSQRLQHFDGVPSSPLKNIATATDSTGFPTYRIHSDNVKEHSQGDLRVQEGLSALLQFFRAEFADLRAAVLPILTTAGTLQIPLDGGATGGAIGPLSIETNNSRQDTLQKESQEVSDIVHRLVESLHLKHDSYAEEEKIRYQKLQTMLEDMRRMLTLTHDKRYKDFAKQMASTADLSQEYLADHLSRFSTSKIQEEDMQLSEDSNMDQSPKVILSNSPSTTHGSQREELNCRSEEPLEQLRAVMLSAMTGPEYHSFLHRLLSEHFPVCQGERSRAADPTEDALAHFIEGVKQILEERFGAIKIETPKVERTGNQLDEELTIGSPTYPVLSKKCLDGKGIGPSPLLCLSPSPTNKDPFLSPSTKTDSRHHHRRPTTPPFLDATTMELHTFPCDEDDMRRCRAEGNWGSSPKILEHMLLPNSNGAATASSSAPEGSGTRPQLHQLWGRCGTEVPLQYEHALNVDLIKLAYDTVTQRLLGAIRKCEAKQDTTLELLSRKECGECEQAGLPGNGEHSTHEIHSIVREMREDLNGVARDFSLARKLLKEGLSQYQAERDNAERLLEDELRELRKTLPADKNYWDEMIQLQRRTYALMLQLQKEPQFSSNSV